MHSTIRQTDSAARCAYNEQVLRNPSWFSHSRLFVEFGETVKQCVYDQKFIKKNKIKSFHKRGGDNEKMIAI